MHAYPAAAREPVREHREWIAVRQGQALSRSTQPGKHDRRPREYADEEARPIGRPLQGVHDTWRRERIRRASAQVLDHDTRFKPFPCQLGIGEELTVG